MELLKCHLVKNDCYTAGKTITPKGVMVHSTGANNPNVKRYVQPAAGQAGCQDLIDILGQNKNANDWNRPNVKKCVHAFIGMLADGTVGAVQTLPWNHRGWHCGSGKAGTANSTHIAFEICEDGLTDPDYFSDVYAKAVELTAYLCKTYQLDPMADGVVICHVEGYRRGVAACHGDVEHWFPKHGKTMDDFRRDVKDYMEVENMTGEEILAKIPADKLWAKLQDYLAAQPLPGWAKADPAYQQALAHGTTDGTTPMCIMPRYQGAIMAERAAAANK